MAVRRWLRIYIMGVTNAQNMIIKLKVSSQKLFKKPHFFTAPKICKKFCIERGKMQNNV